MPTISGRDTYRSLTSGAVIVVAAIAATVSYLHVSGLALKYGQPPLSAYLMPISVDGLVTASSLSLFRAARAGLGSPVVARIGLVLGVLATLGANVASGLSFGPVGAVVAGWPAVAFVIAAEIAVGMVRRKPAKLPAVEPVRDPATRPELVTGNADSVAATVPSRLARMASQENAVMSAMLANPHVTLAELAGILGTSERTARRVRDRVSPLVPVQNGNTSKVVTA